MSDHTWTQREANFFAERNQAWSERDAALHESAADKQRIAELEKKLADKISDYEELYQGYKLANENTAHEMDRAERAESELAIARDLIERHKQERNQCDGCALGLPVNENGIHYRVGEDSAWTRLHMRCTKDKYAAHLRA